MKSLNPHIGIYGRRNNGKSSLINSLSFQDTAIVSDIAGTTTDPVKKSIEMFGLGPVVLIDTAGIDDSGELGEKRISRTKKTIEQIDLAVLVISQNIFGAFEEKLIADFQEYNLPYIIVHNKKDIETCSEELKQKIKKNYNKAVLDYSSLDSKMSASLSDLIIEKTTKTAYTNPSLFGDLVEKSDVVLLITPIDTEAPEGRMILPQVQAIRDILDNDAICVVVKETEVEAFLSKTQIKPKIVVTDSQIFKLADQLIPIDIPLTSFSTLLARYRGNFEAYLKGTPTLSELKKGDRVLLLESCTHHSTCDDIGRVKIPNWLNTFTKQKIEFDIVSGLDQIKRPITDYKLVIQCGGCMITRQQLRNRLHSAINAGIPVTNYGMAIAYMNGIYERAIAPFTKKRD